MVIMKYDEWKEFNMKFTITAWKPLEYDRSIQCIAHNFSSYLDYSGVT